MHELSFNYLCHPIQFFLSNTTKFPISQGLCSPIAARWIILRLKFVARESYWYSSSCCTTIKNCPLLHWWYWKRDDNAPVLIRCTIILLISFWSHCHRRGGLFLARLIIGGLLASTKGCVHPIRRRFTSIQIWFTTDSGGLSVVGRIQPFSPGNFWLSAFVLSSSACIIAICWIIVCMLDSIFTPFPSPHISASLSFLSKATASSCHPIRL